MGPDLDVQMDEARLLLRWAGNHLTPLERRAAEGMAYGIPQRAIASDVIGERRGAVFYAGRRALRKMRERLNSVGIYSVSEVLTE